MRPLTDFERNQAKLMAAIARGRAFAKDGECSYKKAILKEWLLWREEGVDPRITTVALDLALDLGFPRPSCSGDYPL